MSRLSSSSSTEETVMCTICQDEIVKGDGVQVGQLQCTHIFHVECIEENIKHQSKCPNCNQVGDMYAIVLLKAMPRPTVVQRFDDYLPFDPNTVADSQAISEVLDEAKAEEKEEVFEIGCIAGVLVEHQVKRFKVVWLMKDVSDNDSAPYSWLPLTDICDGADNIKVKEFVERYNVPEELQEGFRWEFEVPTSLVGANGRVTYKCPFEDCAHSSPHQNRTNILSHIVNVHCRLPEEFRFRCTECEKTFGNKQHRAHHMRTKHNGNENERRVRQRSD